MNTFKKFAAIAAVTASMVGLGSQAARADDWKFWINNDTPHAIWITVYSFGNERSKVDWFCVNAHSQAYSKKQAYYYHNYAYVRAEVKSASNSCADQGHKWDIKNHGIAVNGSGNEMVTYSASSANQQPSVWNGWH